MQIDLATLHQILIDRFGESDLRTLCFRLRVDYESLPDEGKANKARELIILAERQGRLAELLQIGQDLRPHSVWADLQTAEVVSPLQAVVIPGKPEDEFAHEKPLTLTFPAQPVGAIKVISGTSSGLWVFLTEQTRRIVFGRQADVSIQDKVLSRNHFAVTVQLMPDEAKVSHDYRVQVMDLNSSNGTWVNGRRVQTLADLQNGDLIQVGAVQFEVQLFNE